MFSMTQVQRVLHNFERSMNNGLHRPYLLLIAIIRYGHIYYIQDI